MPHHEYHKPHQARVTSGSSRDRPERTCGSPTRMAVHDGRPAPGPVRRRPARLHRLRAHHRRRVLAAAPETIPARPARRCPARSRRRQWRRVTKAVTTQPPARPAASHSPAPAGAAGAPPHAARPPGGTATPPRRQHSRHHGTQPGTPPSTSAPTARNATSASNAATTAEPSATASDPAAPAPTATSPSPPATSSPSPTRSQDRHPPAAGVSVDQHKGDHHAHS
jgi:hypothetical protein